MVTKSSLEIRQVNQEVGLLDADRTALGIEACTRDQAVNVRMKCQLLVPGMQSSDESVDQCTQPFVSQLLGESGRDSGKEELKGLLGLGTKELSAQLRRESEGDQEVGSVDALGPLALDPSGGVGVAALWTGFVIAGVISQVDSAAGFTEKSLCAQGGRAAMSDSPDGAPLLRGKSWLLCQKGGQKTAQHFQDRRLGAHDVGGRWRLTGQSLDELIHQTQGIARGLMGQMQIDHGGSDLLVTEQFLDGVQMSSGFQQMCGEGMS